MHARDPRQIDEEIRTATIALRDAQLSEREAICAQIDHLLTEKVKATRPREFKEMLAALG